MIQAIHTAVEGRARYKVCGLYGSASLKRHLESRLAEYDGIHAVSASTRTGNVLVSYQPDTHPEEIVALLARMVAEYHNTVCYGHSVPQGNVSTNGARVGEMLPDASVPLASHSAGRRTAPQAEAQHQAPWHVLDAAAVTTALETSQTSGLSGASANERLQTYGPNLPPESMPRSGWSILLEQFTSLPVALLGVAAGISLMTGGLADAVVIAGVVAINATIGYVTESQAEQTIHSLKNLVRPASLALRDGHLDSVRSEELVPGDVLVLQLGSYVAADARLLDAQCLNVDESALTGESLPVAKSTAALADPSVSLADRQKARGVLSSWRPDHIPKWARSRPWSTPRSRQRRQCRDSSARWGGNWSSSVGPDVVQLRARHPLLRMQHRAPSSATS